MLMSGWFEGIVQNYAFGFIRFLRISSYTASWPSTYLNTTSYPNVPAVLNNIVQTPENLSKTDC